MLAVNISNVFIVVSIISGFCKVYVIIYGILHSLFLVFSYLDSYSKDIDIFIFPASVSKRISGAKQEILFFKGIVYKDAEKIVHIMAFLYVVDSVCHPVIDYLGIQFLIFRR